MKKISVITPCHNSITYLDQCIQSLVNQTIGIENMQCIFVDDASTDDTWKRIQSFQKEYPDSVTAIRLPYHKRQGGARNEAFQYVTGTYTAFLDSDDEALPQAYEILYETAMQTGSDMIQFNHYNCTENEKVLQDHCKLEGTIRLKDIETRKLFLMAEVCSLCHCTKLYRTELIRKSQVKFAEHRIYEEPLFVYPLFFYATSVTSMKHALYNVRLHAQSTMHRDAKESARLLDHPQVQMLLLEKMMEHSDWIKNYFHEIEFYFLKTYYLETLYIAKQAKLQLPFDYFIQMQQNVQKHFSNWRDNMYLQEEDTNMMRSVLETAERQLNQKDLDELCATIYEYYK